MTFFKVFSIFNISGSGLSAQRKNLQVRAENIANVDAIDQQTGRPYQAKDVDIYSNSSPGAFRKIFDQTRLMLRRNSMYHFPNFTSHLQSGEEPEAVEAKVVTRDTGTRLIYNPAHPRADENGYVEVADINTINEMVEMMAAARSYEANVSVLEAAKTMFKKALDI